MRKPLVILSCIAALAIFCIAVLTVDLKLIGFQSQQDSCRGAANQPQQQYFDRMQCERIPQWFETYLQSKGPDYCPTVVFVSTTSRRLLKKTEMVLKAIRSISLEQTRPPDAVFLVLPQYSLVDRAAYLIPDSINTTHLLKSCRDYGPGTKFMAPLFTFRNHPCARLISFDDDMIYDTKTLETYYQYDVHPEKNGFNNPPNSSILTSWGDYPATKSKDLIGKRPKVVGSPLGVYSYMYQPKFFDLQHIVWPSELRPAFYREDDIWFGCIAKSMNLTTYVVPGLDQKPQDFCPLDECLHNAVDDRPARNHFRKYTTCNPGAYLKWKDDYYPEQAVITNVHNKNQ